MAGFRLHPGPLPEQYRMSMQVPTKKKQKKKKNKVSYKIRLDPTYEDGGIIKLLCKRAKCDFIII